MRLETQESKDVRYIKPKDKFYPLRLYKQCCKDSKWTKKERRLHTFDHQDGVNGYFVPNPDADNTPWEVESSMRFSTQKTTLEAEVAEKGDFHE